MAKAAKNLNEVLEQLRSLGLKRTQARRAILSLMVAEHGPFSSEEIHYRLKGHGCDLVTIYRNVLALEKVGLLRRCSFGDRIHRYELADSDDQHHHVVCKKCSTVTVVENCIPKAVLEKLEKKGFSDLECRFEIFSICPKCNKSKGLNKPNLTVRRNISPSN